MNDSTTHVIELSTPIGTHFESDEHDFKQTDQYNDTNFFLGTLYECKKCDYKHLCRQGTQFSNCTHNERFNKGCTR